MFYLIFAIVSFLVLMVIFGFLCEWNDKHFGVSFVLSSFVSMWCSLFVLVYNDQKETNQCL